MFEDTVAHYRTIIDDISYPTVTEWKTNNPSGKVVGMFPVYTPYELPHAMGMLPIGVFGAGGKIEIDHADSRIQSFVCSIARSTLELGLTGHLKQFDAMYFTSICDVARNLSGVWKMNFPNTLIEYIHFPQNVESPAAIVHYRDELAHLVSRLETLCGTKVTTDALNQSLSVYNRNRELTAQLYALKRNSPEKLSTYELYVLLRVGTLVSVEDHTKMLESALAEATVRTGKHRDLVRVVLEGSFCEQPPLDLIKVIEEAGCAVINDDFMLHTRWFISPVPITDDPLGALAEWYVKKSISSSVRHYGATHRSKSFFAKVQELKADGVIFAAPKFCEPALLDYVTMKNDLEKKGISYLAFEYEEKMGVFETIRTQVETFVESVMFFS